MKKKSLKKQLKEVKKEPKQLIVGGIILLVAILLLVFSFVGEKAQLKVSENVSQKPVAEKTVQKAAESAFVQEKQVDIATTEETPAENNAIEEEPEYITVTFTATLEKNITFQIFYTDIADVDYSEIMSVTEEATAGTNSYNIVLPMKRIYKFRIDFGEAPGAVTIKDIKLTGSQVADLNDFSQYDINQMENITVNKDGSLSFTSEEEDPFISHKTILK